MKKDGNWLYGVCAVLLPVIVLLHLYRQNIEHTLFLYLAISSAICVVCSLALFLVFYKLSKSPLTAFLMTLVFCTVFFSAGSIVDFLTMRKIASRISLITVASAWGVLLVYVFLVRCMTRRQRYACICTALGSVAIWCVLRYVLQLSNFKMIPIFILVFLLACVFVFTRQWKAELPLRFFTLFTGLLLLMTGLPVLAQPMREPTPPDTPAYKRPFTVEEDVPSPNVYWFHCDAMLGFEGVERFWGDTQAEFGQALQSRGFAINRSAQFEARHRTRNAIPILMCPEYYDTELSFYFDPAYAFARAGLPVPEGYTPGALPKMALNAAREKTELVTAFEQAGYHVSTISNETIHFIFQGSQFYDLDNAQRPLVNESYNASVLQRIQQKDTFRLLGSSILSVIDKWLIENAHANPDYYSAIEQRVPDALWDGLAVPAPVRVAAQCLADILEQPGPKLTLVNYNVAHYPFLKDEYGNETGNDQLDDYLPQHRFAAKVLLKLVDLVLAKDPDAVIVLMSDHGLHNESIEDIMAQKNCSKKEARLLHNSVLSAVRAPNSEGKLPADPRDVSRYLINSFVGQNYDYINGPLQ